ncbi:hypothetical protein FHU12_3253 [Serratia marcescens]|uniref:Uncharacterized protein n=1 Tax=Serratia marcescens TaxID=615 RepID=A0AA46K789_SERMA|nr:hypothetical protein [Serratia marcescens]TQI85682.1 hypothetical protein FHU12_3253 [Serratia marcescens]HEJ7121078.1 hypothetical protein [Serratia marcescens]
MTLTTERQQFAEQNEMSMDFVNWFFDKKKDGCGNAWFIMAAAMWEGWKGQAANREAQPVALDVIAKFKEWNTGFPVEKFKADYVIGWVLANYYAPPAPAVPPEASPDDIPQEHNINKYSGITWAAAWNACRAAMLKGERP